MAGEQRPWVRQGETFWRAHHEAWKRSDLNQRQYCETQGIPRKAFENWRAQFKAEPQPPERKLLYRRRPLSPPLSPPVSPPISPVTYTTLSGSRDSGKMACTRFRRHRVRCFDGTGGASWRGGSLHASSSLRLCGIKERDVRNEPLLRHHETVVTRFDTASSSQTRGGRALLRR